MGAMLTTLAQVAFGLGLAGNMLWAAGLMKLVSILPLSKRRKQHVALLLTQAAWRIAILFAPWMRCVGSAQNDEEWKLIQKSMAASDAEAAASKTDPKPLFVLGNHTSFFDTLLFTKVVPATMLMRLRTYMDNHLFKLPILATVCRSCGQFPVHFKSTAEGVFKVDQEKAAEVDKLVNEHLKDGGWLCFFPEGSMNKTPDTLLPFRYGGMKKAIEYDARFLSFVAVGNPDVWPKKAQIGGLPGSVKYGVKCLAPNGVRALLAELRGSKDLSAEDRALEDPALLAKFAQEAMQKQYNDLKASMTGKSIKSE